MAVRPVYIAKNESPFYSVWNCEFTYNAGFSKQQKQKNITAIHTSFESLFEGRQVLEISSKSMQELGVKLSAFNLTKFVPKLGKSVPVECVYQAGKVFADGNQYEDLLLRTPREAKKDERLSSSGRIVAFSFDGKNFATEPKNAFYDHLYVNALLEHEELLNELLKYDAFTDIEFNPEKSINCQARAAAVLVGLVRSGNIEKAKNFDEFSKLFGDKMPVGAVAVSSAKTAATVKTGSNNVMPPENKTLEFAAGQRIKHPTFGDGEIVQVCGVVVTVKFDVGEKTLSGQWIEANCELV